MLNMALKTKVIRKKTKVLQCRH